VNFGTVEAPEPPKTAVVLIETIRVSNPGTAALRGEVRIRIDSTLPRPPAIRLSPEGTDPFFLLPPGGSVEIVLSATVTDSTSTGDHRGTLSFGTPCPPIPIFLNFTAAG
jgi:hypothetical protein